MRTLSLHVPAAFTRTSSNFWTSVSFATLSVFPSLICGSCPSGQRFAYSFFQIPSHGGHPCCSAMCFVVAYAHSGLSPVRDRPCWANKSRPSENGKAALRLNDLLVHIYIVYCGQAYGRRARAMTNGSNRSKEIISRLGLSSRTFCFITNYGQFRRKRG